MAVGSLIAELSRRRVFRALVGYGIAAFAVLQIVEPVMHGLHWPDEVLSYVVVALAVGFPIIVSLAWIFDVKAGRIERTAPATEGFAGARLGLVLVAIGALAAAPGTIWYFAVRGIARPRTVTAATDARPPSIAVLPFVNLSSDKEQEYFSDGIAEEILNELAQVDGLQVTGRTSSFSFKGKTEDLRSIGRSLGVGTVLEGSVRKAGNRVRVTAQVVKVEDGFHLWSQTYDRDLTDIFVMQDEIARAVVAALKVKLLPSRAAPTEPRKTSPEAFSQYLLAKQLWFRIAYDRAVDAYERALELDPKFASAWAGKGLALRDRGEQIGTLDSVRGGCKQGLEAVDRAVALDPYLPEAYSARALIRCWCFFDWTGGSTDAERALELGPGDAASHRRDGIVKLEVGRVKEAIAELRRTTEIDPLDPYAWNWLANAYAAAGQFDLARRSLTRAFEISPEFEAGLGMVWLSIMEGRSGETLTILERVNSLPAAGANPGDEANRLSLLAMAHHDLGHAAASQKALDALLAKAPAEMVAYEIARVYAWTGDRDRAFNWLERAFAQRYIALSDVKWTPSLRKLRDDPRYTALLKKMNLPLD